MKKTHQVKKANRLPFSLGKACQGAVSDPEAYIMCILISRVQKQQLPTKYLQK